MRNYSRRKLNNVFNKPRLERKVRPSFINNEVKEWEVRFGDEKDGPLDAQEVMALLNACKDVFTIKNMTTGKKMNSKEFKNFYVNGEPKIVSRFKPPVIMEREPIEPEKCDFSRFIGFNNKDDSIADELLKYGGQTEWEEPGGDPESLGQRNTPSPVNQVDELTNEDGFEDDEQCIIEEVIGRDQIQRMSKMGFDQNLDILRNNEIFLASPKKKPKKKKKNQFDRLRQLNRINR